MEATIVIGLYWDHGKENGNYYSNWGYIGIMEKNMEATIVIGVILGQWKRTWKLLP